MYFVFRPETVVGTKEILYAKRHPDYADFSEIHEDWYGSKPLSQDFPSIKFTINQVEPKLDNYNTGTKYDLYSDKLVNLLEQKNINFEAFPVSVFGKDSVEITKASYQVFRLLEDYPAFNMAQTIIGKWGVKKMVLTKKFLESGVMMTRVSQSRSTVLVHRDLKNFLESNKITGCQFTSIETQGIYHFVESKLRGKNQDP